MPPPHKDPSDRARAISQAPIGAQNAVAKPGRATSQPPSIVKDGVKGNLEASAETAKVSINRGKAKSVSFTEDDEDEDVLKIPTQAKSEAPTALAATPSNIVPPSIHGGSMPSTSTSSTALVARPISDGQTVPLSGSPDLISSVIKDCAGPAMTALTQSPTLDALSTKEDPASLARFPTTPAILIEPEIHDGRALTMACEPENAYLAQLVSGIPFATNPTPSQLIRGPASIQLPAPIVDRPLQSIEPKDTSIAQEENKAQNPDTDVHMSEVASSDSQPPITTAEINVSISGARTVTPDPEVSITTTPAGTPAHSIPDSSHRNIPKIYTSSGEVATETAISFPNCVDGDVLVVSSTGRTWKLHATTLRNSSSILRDLIDGAEAHRPNKRRKNEDKSVRWKILMVPWEEEAQDNRFRTFKIMDVHSKQSFLMPENTNGVGISELRYNKVYDNFFRILYNFEPHLTPPHGHEIKIFIADAVSILKAAEYLGAGPAVRPVVENSFLRLNQLLYKHIARNPAAWTDIALRLQSAVLFRVAMAHVVGRFDLRGRDGINKEFLKGQPNGELLMEFAGRKAMELRNQKLRIERLMMEYYPQRMQHPQAADEHPPNRETYSNDIYCWQALTLVRQYFASAMLSNMNHKCNDGGAYFYQCVGAGNEHYLRRDVLERFHANFAMSTKGKECLLVAVQFVKEAMREVVRPLLVDQSLIHRRPEDPMPRYLTCCEITDEELPWLVGKMQSEDEA